MTLPPLHLNTIESTIRDCPAHMIADLAHSVLQDWSKQVHGYLLLSPHLPAPLLPRVFTSLARCKDPWVLHRPQWHAHIPVNHVAAFRNPNTCQLLIHLHRAVLLGLTPASCLPDLRTQQAQLLPHLLQPTPVRQNQLTELRSLQETLSLLTYHRQSQLSPKHPAEPDPDTYCVRSEARGQHGYFSVHRFRIRSSSQTLGDLSECAGIRIELNSQRPSYAPGLILFSLPDAYAFHARLTALLHPDSRATPTTLPPSRTSS